MYINPFSIALTGPRYSGKTGVSKIFRSMGIPVFDADIVIKYILNYNEEITTQVKNFFGNSYVICDYINPIAFDNDEKFNSLIDLVEFDLFEAYYKFQKKNKKSVYTIFKSSLIFERNYQKKFNHTISVFSPKEERISRYSMRTGTTLEKAHSLFKGEMDEMRKNQLSDFIIHNYQGSEDIKKQIQLIDDKIVDKYFSINANKTDMEDILPGTFPKNMDKAWKSSEWLDSIDDKRHKNKNYKNSENKYNSVDNHSHIKNLA